MTISLVGQLPVWLGGLLFFILLMVALEFGFRAGTRQRDGSTYPDGDGGNLVLTSVLALLGLMLAFTFADGVSYYKIRKQAVIAEANAIGTAFLRADMVADPGRTELKSTLLEYARSRVVKTGSSLKPEQVRTLIDRSSQEIGKLWPITLGILEQETPGAIEASLVSAINKVIDHHTIRKMAVHDKLPQLVFVLLIFVTVASHAVAGFNAGVSGKLNRWRMTIFALVVSAVVYVINDFDRPASGFIVINQDPLFSAIADMEADLNL